MDLLETRFESSEEEVWIARRRAALDVWLGWIATLLELDSGRQWPSSFPNSGGRFLLTSRDCPEQAGHNKFPVQAQDLPAFFLITTAEQETSLWKTPGSYLYVQYEEETRKTISAGLVLNETTIPPYSVFVGHGYFQHAGVGWRGNHALRYHMYFIPNEIQMKDSVYYAYNRSFRKEGERPPSRLVS